MNLKDQILDSTNGGLTILQDLFPFFDEKKQFKAEEDEASESAKARYKNGQWQVCVFDADRSPSDGYHNAIDWYMYFNKLEFTEAIKRLAVEKGITKGAPIGLEVETIDEKREYTGFRIPGEMRTPTPDECKSLGRFVKPEDCDKLGVLYLVDYEYTNRDNITKRYKSSEINPIFYLSLEKKIYAPKSADKKYRYMATEPMPDANTSLRGVDIIKNDFKKRDDDKYSEIIICCGYRDALNVFSVGYQVVWMSSESLKITRTMMQQLKDYAHEIYYVNDLDPTGYAVAHQTCMQYLNLKRIYLPEELKEKKDHRGKACKDVTDYLKHYGDVSFKILLNGAAPYKFWYEYEDSKGETKTKISRHWLKLFIIANGFRRYQFDDGKGYVHIVGNMVRKVEQEDIKSWVNHWAQSRGFGRAVLDMISGTRDMSEAVLNEINIADLKFSTADHDHQLMVFDEKIWKITPDGINAISQGSLETYVWNHKIGLRDSGQVLRPKIKEGGKFSLKLQKKKVDNSFVLDGFFELINKDGKLDIKILRRDCQWFKFLINTCRVHWKKEVNHWAADQNKSELSMGEKQRLFAKAVEIDITSKYLSDEENEEQKIHLINRIFTTGYLMHRHKFRSKSWLVWCMDYKVESVKDSKGRSGKSLMPQSFEHLKTFASENGRDHNLTKKNHIFADVTSLTDLLIINDSHSYLDLSYFFNYVTDNLSVNPKNVAQRTIPFDQAGKLIVTSNFGPNQLDDSTQDRIIFNLFGDWYHSEKDFGSDYRPSDDFGGQLFDWDSDEWNNYYNFVAQCCMHHFTMPKCSAPMDQIIKRENMKTAGDLFTDWANETLLPLLNRPVYDPSKDFAEDPTIDGLADYEFNKGTYIIRKKAMHLFNEYAGNNKISTNAFTKKLKSWSAMMSIEVNPKHTTRDDGRISRYVSIGAVKKSEEAFFLYQENPEVAPYSGTGPIPQSKPIV